MPLPRFRLRTLMIVVAFVGVLLGVAFEVVRLRSLSREYEKRALAARGALRQRRLSAGLSQVRWPAERDALPFQYGWHMAPLLPPDVARRHLAYWASLALKNERAAQHPWLPVAPDPPRPE